MPFTPSHAVLALPFLRTPLVPAAIAVGAMTPDLPLFVRHIVPSYAVTHAFAWLPLTMTIALVLLLVWRFALRPAARELSPRALATRLPALWDAGPGATARETFPSVRGIALLAVSLALGVLSHIVWDLFTHEGRWGSRILPVLDERWGPLTGYKWLQHGSSVVGVLVIAVWAILWFRRADPAAPVHRILSPGVRAAWWLSLPAILAVAWLIGLAAYGPLDQDWTIAHLAYRVLPPACAIWGALTLALCIVVQTLRRGRGGTPQSA